MASDRYDEKSEPLFTVSMPPERGFESLRPLDLRSRSHQSRPNGVEQLRRDCRPRLLSPEHRAQRQARLLGESAIAGGGCRTSSEPRSPPAQGLSPEILAVGVSRVKIRDRGAASDDERVRFSSAILPKWSRRTRSLDALLPVLYLRGISTGDFQEALTALLGKDAPNLSPSVVSLTKDHEALLAFFDFPAEHWTTCEPRTPSRASSPPFDTGRCVPRGHSRRPRHADGLQAGDGGLEDLAAPERREPVAQGRRRCHLPRRDRGHRPHVTPRRLTAASPKFPHSSCGASGRPSYARLNLPIRGRFSAGERTA